MWPKKLGKFRTSADIVITHKKAMIRSEGFSITETASPLSSDESLNHGYVCLIITCHPWVTLVFCFISGYVCVLVSMVLP